MKLTVPAKELAAALSWVASAVPARPADPVLAGIVVEASADGLRLSAFDYDTGLRATVPDAVVDVPGVALIPGRVFAAVAARMRGEVTIAELTDRPGVQIKAGRATYTLDLIPLDRYPSVDGWFQFDPTAAVDAELLQLALAKVAHAADSGDSVPVLSAVHLAADDGRLWFSTTDRYRLARYYLPYSGAFGSALPVARKLGDVVKGLHGQVRIGEVGGVLSIADATHHAAMRCLDGEFPKVEILVHNAERASWTTRFNRVEMIEALTRLLAVHDSAGTTPPPVALSIQPDGIDLTFTSQSSANSGAEYVACEARWLGDEGTYTWPVEQRLNPHFLLEVLKAHAADEVALGNPDPLRPMPLMVTGDAAMQSVVMPVRK